MPDGWIVVTAGNPTEYNRTAHNFDIATWDRLKRIDVEPDFAAWRDYAVQTGVHPAVLTYLDIERDHFYRVETTVDGTSFVTARGWDDLSAMMKLYEEQGIPVDELLIGQYVQNAEIAKRFSVYYDLFTKYRADYQIDRIQAGEADAGVVERARAAGFDERVSLMGLITDALGGRLRDAVLEERAVAFAHGRLTEMRDVILSKGGETGDLSAILNGASEVERSRAASAVDTANALPLLRDETAVIQRRLETERKAGLLSDEKYVSYERTLALFDRAMRAEVAAEEGVPFAKVKTLFGELVDALDARIATASEALDNAFRFVEDAFGEGQEMLLLVTDLSVSHHGMSFINDHGCERYFKHNEALLFHERGTDLANRINQLDLSAEG